MKITFISDTHTKHTHFTQYLKGGEVIVCCGDITSTGSISELVQFVNWYKLLPYNHKILIAGNHDFVFERKPLAAKDILINTDIIYLEDAEVSIEGIKFYGSPVTPFFFNWAFNRHRGTAIKKHWNKIPDDTDVLITHGPPHKIHDETTNRIHVGCVDLLKTVNRIKPKIHAFGHIHEQYGQTRTSTHFINVSLLNEYYHPAHRPVTIQLSTSKPV
jgi:Icc-related predicted phosphoesterase